MLHIKNKTGKSERIYDETQGFLIFKGTVPIPPSVNSSKVVGAVKGKEDTYRMYSSIDLRVFKAKAKPALRKAQRDQKRIDRLKKLPLAKRVPLSIHLIFYFPYWWKQDDDNYVKHVKDAICEAMGFATDSACTDTHSCKRVVDGKVGICAFEVYEMMEVTPCVQHAR